MIVWCDGLDFPIQLQAGDVLFIAGCMPLDLTQKPLFEHVVITAESRLVDRPENFLEVPVYGMPESSPDVTMDIPGILLQNGRRWLGRITESGTIGSSETVWNLGSRAPSVDESTAKEIELSLAQRAGSFPCRYDAVFRVDPSLSRKIKTNCLGFVCSVLEYFGLEILSHNFPLYPSPYSYSPDAREFPSPGHLAHALKMDPPDLPWRALDSTEAEKYARADVTLDEVLSDQAPNPN